MAEIFYFNVYDDRSIRFPVLEPILQEDKDVATWRFRIPKVLNDIDMSGWAWWFVYVNAAGNTHTESLTLVNDEDDPDNYSTADYDIDYGISYTPGKFTFALEAINADSGGTIANEWHTKTYEHKVTKTLQGNQAEYAETQSDIISALIVQVQNLAVSTSQIADGAVTAEKIASSAVTTAKIADEAVTNAKLDSRLQFLINLNLNNLTYCDNVSLPVTTSYVEAITYMDSYYYVVCRNYSDNTCYIAKYDADFNFVTSVYTNSTYGVANNIFNDGEYIYVDYDNGYHVKFDTSLTAALAVQNTTIRNLAFWNDTLYGVYIDADAVTVYQVESDLTTKTELFSINTTRYTLQSASIIDGILFIPTTKGMFKFIDMETHSIIAEVPYYDSKEIESFFEDADGVIKCCGHFYGLNGVFNIGTFDGGVDGAKMQYSDVDGTDGDYSAFSKSSYRYGFYHISNGTSMGLPCDNGDLLLFEESRLFMSLTNNVIYAYANSAWNLVGFMSKTRISIKVNNYYVHFELNTDGHLTIRCDYLPITSATTTISVNLSALYTALGLSSTKTFTTNVIGTTNGAVATYSSNVATSGNEVYVAQIYVAQTSTIIYTRNVTQDSTENIDAKFSFYQKLV